MEREQKDNLHEDNEKNEAEQKREDLQPADPPDTTKKKEGTTSAFSAATLKKEEE